MNRLVTDNPQTNSINQFLTVMDHYGWKIEDQEDQ